MLLPPATPALPRDIDDRVQLFLDERCIEGPRETNSRLYAAFTTWESEKIDGDKHRFYLRTSHRAMSLALKRLGWSTCRSHLDRCWVGLALKT